jgi:3-deoxy-D-manno-octulosonic-acid transferase
MDASLALLLDSERAQAREAAEARVREVEETALAQSELDGKKLNAYAAQARELRAVVKTYEAAEPQLRGEVRELRAALEEEHWRFASTYAPGVNNHGSVCKLCALLARTEIPKQ